MQIDLTDSETFELLRALNCRKRELNEKLAQSRRVKRGTEVYSERLKIASVVYDKLESASLR